jgi:predicted secreted protein/Tol biopolymer transport system component
MKKKISLGFVPAILALAAGITYADFIFGEPTNLGPAINSRYVESAPFISPDGLSLFFASDWPDGNLDYDIWVTTRASIYHPWSEPVKLGEAVNTTDTEWHPSITADGLELYFDSDRPGGQGSEDIWVSKRQSTEEQWATPVNLGATINTPDFEEAASISPDGLVLVWDSNRPDGFGESDIWMSTRSSRQEPWSDPVNLGPNINTQQLEATATLSADGKALFFTAWPWEDGHGDFDIWMARKSNDESGWQTPVNLGPIINTPSSEYCPSISADGTMLYFSDLPLPRPGGLGLEDLWQAPIIPVVDLNGDGFVDAGDVSVMVDNWGTDNSLCDVGPMPWGDGIVDVQDLLVLAEHLFEKFPPAEPKEVGEDDNGGQIELELGRILVVTLESNPTTGYKWEQADAQEHILQQKGEAVFIPADTGEMPLAGGGGQQVLRFKAIRTGRTTLKLIYHRPWEQGLEPLQSYSLEVLIN